MSSGDVSRVAWFDSRGPEWRERVFAAMRALDHEYYLHMQSVRVLQCPADTIAVGAGQFDAVLEAEIRREFLAALRKGADPEVAGVMTRAAATVAIVKHNAHRPNDVHWQRWTGGGQPVIDNLVRRFKALESMP